MTGNIACSNQTLSTHEETFAQPSRRTPATPFPLRGKVRMGVKGLLEATVH